MIPEGIRGNSGIIHELANEDAPRTRTLKSSKVPSHIDQKLNIYEEPAIVLSRTPQTYGRVEKPGDREVHPSVRC